jgi:hypothetical protein
MNKERRQAIGKLITQVSDLSKIERAEGKIDFPSEAALVKIAYDNFIAVVTPVWEELSEAIAGLSATCDELCGEIEDAKNEEQEYYDNMPEGLQNGEKGQAASNAVDALQQAYDALSEIAGFDFPDFSALDMPDVDDLLSKLDEAQTGLETAQGE